MQDKDRVREVVATARRQRPADERERLAAALADRVLALPELAAAQAVAAYASIANEPGTGPLLAALHARGVRVLLPVLQADGDLDWAADDGELAPGLRPSVREPTGPRLGPAAVTDVDVVVCPATAVALDGTRLGKGGGSYDRALARTTALAVALVHDDEVVEVLPRDAHDRPVDVAVTPTRTVRLTARTSPPG